MEALKRAQPNHIGDAMALLASNDARLGYGRHPYSINGGAKTLTPGRLLSGTLIGPETSA